MSSLLKSKFAIFSYVIVGIIALSSLGSNNTTQNSAQDASVKGSSTQQNLVEEVAETSSLPTSSLLPSPTPSPTPTPTPTLKPSLKPLPIATTTYQTPQCSNGTYVNSAGNTVCSPEYAPSEPAGASAQCADGTYSYSQSRSGTCSHHGGVARWL